jgi:hypothetical protein
MFRLPVSRLTVVIQQPTGVEDLLLQEVQSSDAALSLALIRRLVQVADGGSADWGELTITDLEALMLLLRLTVLGDTVRGETRCTRPGCETRVDVSFSIGKFLASQKIRSPRAVEKADAEGWFQLVGERAKFRLPSGRVLMVIDQQRFAERELLRQCVEPANVRSNVRERIERAMQAMAPPLSRTLMGECPECHSQISIYFNVQSFVLRELRDHAAGIYQDIHLLALHYKWLEEDILALPRNRRMRYAEMVRSQGTAA